MEGKRFSGYRVLIGACIVGLVNQGSTSLFSIFLTSIAESLNADIGSLLYLVTIATVVAVVGDIMLGKVLEVVSVRVCLAIATICLALNCVLAAIAKHVWVLYICGALSGIGIAFGTVAPVAIIVNDWFVEKRSQMMGIAVGVLMLGSVVMLFVGSRVAEVLDWRQAEYVCAAIILVLGLLPNLLVVRTTAQLGERAFGYELATVANEGGDDSASLIGVTFDEAVKSPSFWLLFVSFIACGIGVEGVASYGPTYYMSYGVDELFASNMGMLYMGILFLSSVIGGIVAEKFGNKALTAIMCTALAAGLVLVSLWAGSGSQTFLTAAVVVISIGGPTCMLLAPALCADVFGPANYESISPVIVASGYIGSALSAFAMNAVLAATGEMKGFYLVFGIAAAVAMVLVFIAINRSPLKKAA